VILEDPSQVPISALVIPQLAQASVVIRGLIHADPPLTASAVK
jgi:hypothetical protein